MKKIQFNNYTGPYISAETLKQMQDNIEEDIIHNSQEIATMHLAEYGEGAEEGSIDPNTTLKPLILSRHANVPKANTFYYIHTMFYSEIATTANRTQVAIGYKTSDIHQRYYNIGVWSEWIPVNETNIVTAFLSEDYIIQKDNTYEKIPFNQATKIGTRLTLQNGLIVIGKGIKAVKVSAKIQLPSGGLTNGGKNIVVTKNGSNISRGMYSQTSIANSYYVLPEIVEEVQEGDKIGLSYYGSAGNTISGGKLFTNMTIEAILD